MVNKFLRWLTFADITEPLIDPGEEAAEENEKIVRYNIKLVERTNIINTVYKLIAVILIGMLVGLLTYITLSYLLVIIRYPYYLLIANSVGITSIVVASMTTITCAWVSLSMFNRDLIARDING